MAECKTCQDERWVCEAHPDRPWNDSKPNGCTCGAGMPCPDCNPSDVDHPPGMQPGFSPDMGGTADRYQCLRSHSDVHLFVVCYADRFYSDVPKAVRDLGPWRGDCRGEVVRLKPEIRATLARDGYVLVNTPSALFQPEA